MCIVVDMQSNKTLNLNNESYAPMFNKELLLQEIYSKQCLLIVRTLFACTEDH